MAKLEWNSPGQRKFESGVDRGVLYLKSGLGIVWNGLVSVDQKHRGGETTPYYQDGHKYINEISREEFLATITAFTYPDEFENLDGSVTSGGGLLYNQQRRTPFGFSWRTLYGDDISGENSGYKLHIVYNALAEPSNNRHETISESVEPSLFIWEVSSTPVFVSGRIPTSHITIDSNFTPSDILEKVEGILYGTEYESPRLPELSEIVDLFDDWPIVEIIPNTDSGLSSLRHRGVPDLKGNVEQGLFKKPAGSRLYRLTIDGLSKLRT